MRVCVRERDREGEMERDVARQPILFMVNVKSDECEDKGEGGRGSTAPLLASRFLRKCTTNKMKPHFCAIVC